MPSKLDDLTPENVDKRRMEVALAAMRSQAAEADKKAAFWHSQYEKAKDDFDNLASIKEPVDRNPIMRSFPHRASQSGVVMVNWSDWHVAEVVDKKKVRGLNSYSPEIARDRSRKCAASTLKLWRYIRSSYSVDTMILFLGGDFISGYLHPELEQTNAMAPVEESRFAKELLFDAIELLAAEKTIKHLRIVGMRGNHGRTTKKMQFKNDYESSYESWIYWDLQHRFDDGKRILFDVPKGDVYVVPIVKDKFRLRLFHGHQIRYQDGVGGLTIPLNKWLSKQDRIESADFNLMGHYHMFSQPSMNTILNGSNKGFDEYAASHGFAYQDPLQTFALLDVGRKIVAQTLPIFCT